MNSNDVHDELRAILNSWDPIGVADEAPDEYDCLHAPLVNLLTVSQDHERVASLLRSQLENHFELDPSNPHVDEVAEKLLQWWKDRRPHKLHD